MAELKTKAHDGDVRLFLEAVEHKQRREDSLRLLGLLEEWTGEQARMWGPAIVGLGEWRLVYANGREADWFLAGFSPRKQALTLYLTAGFSHLEDLMEKLGPHKTGKGCLYLKKLDDVDLAVLKEMVCLSIEHLKTGNLP